MEAKPRKAYPSDVSDKEWAFVAAYLTPIPEEAPQRVYDLQVYTGEEARKLPKKKASSWK